MPIFTQQQPVICKTAKVELAKHLYDALALCAECFNEGIGSLSMYKKKKNTK
jgi:hypothetical protein